MGACIRPVCDPRIGGKEVRNHEGRARARERDSAKDAHGRWSTYTRHAKMGGFHRYSAPPWNVSLFVWGGSDWGGPETNLANQWRRNTRAMPSDAHTILESSISSKQCRKCVSDALDQGNQRTRSSGGKGSRTCPHPPTQQMWTKWQGRDAIPSQICTRMNL